MGSRGEGLCKKRLVSLDKWTRRFVFGRGPDLNLPFPKVLRRDKRSDLRPMELPD